MAEARVVGGDVAKCAVVSAAVSVPMEEWRLGEVEVCWLAISGVGEKSVLLGGFTLASLPSEVTGNGGEFSVSGLSFPLYGTGSGASQRQGGGREAEYGGDLGTPAPASEQP